MIANDFHTLILGAVDCAHWIKAGHALIADHFVSAVVVHIFSSRPFVVPLLLSHLQMMSIFSNRTAYRLLSLTDVHAHTIHFTKVFIISNYNFVFENGKKGKA